MIFLLCQTMVHHGDRLPHFHRWRWVTPQTADTVAAFLFWFCLFRYPQLFLPAFPFVHCKPGSLLSHCLTFFGWREVLSDIELSLPEEAPGLGVQLGSGICESLGVCPQSRAKQMLDSICTWSHRENSTPH